MATRENFNTTTLSDIASYIARGTVSFLEVSSRDEAIKELVEKLAEAKPLLGKEEFLQATLEREKVASTGIGMGFAIPHAKLSIYDDFFIAVGILNKRISWNSMDGVPVKIIFLIGGPDDRQTQYLKLLSQLTLYLRDEEIRKKLLTLTAPEQIIQIFQS